MGQRCLVQLLVLVEFAREIGRQLLEFRLARDVGHLVVRTRALIRGLRVVLDPSSHSRGPPSCRPLVKTTVLLHNVDALLSPLGMAARLGKQ